MPVPGVVLDDTGVVGCSVVVGGSGLGGHGPGSGILLLLPVTRQ